ncbi:MAG: GIY-YIG nuclease family protein [Candidatus Roizmanbacteria bacterium]|nr:GIY-YIG nuclease family protein [Candidatus Roizmanbacteria bacterium]MCR4312851.1 GIY-YIG nuclease family protein [Candidatus Roizmanbacteria bacterium]
MYFIYILRCSDNSLYCGQTKDLDRRIKEHNSDISISKYTRVRRPVELVYFEKHRTLSKVLKREFEIKKLTKIEKEELIRNVIDRLDPLLQGDDKLHLQKY